MKNKSLGGPKLPAQPSHNPNKELSAESVPLNFKVPAEFRRDRKIEADTVGERENATDTAFCTAPAAPAGHSELEPLELSEQELDQLLAFLPTLSKPPLVPDPRVE